MNWSTALQTNNTIVKAIHLDTVGGIAGDMFAASILDAYPGLFTACEEALQALAFDKNTKVYTEKHIDCGFTGTRFIVDDRGSKNPISQHHVHWTGIRKFLGAASLDNTVREIAIDIFSILAKAEATVHGVSEDEVSFHEIGAIDSIIDIVIASVLINKFSSSHWTVSPLPRGRGQIKSQHGYIPLPAPASALILKDFIFFDDGEEGERVTPTGAAILKHLNPVHTPDASPRPLLTLGMGLGKRRLKTRANLLRATFYGESDRGIEQSNADVLRCEIDDQTAEDLAIAIDHLRSTEGVIDVCQWTVFAKKGRIAIALQVIAEPPYTDAIIAKILDETETLGVRQCALTRHTLPRQNKKIDNVQVKLAHRPDGVSAKAEMDDLAAGKSVIRRKASRLKAETKAIEEIEKNDK